eukprot:584981_1
MLEMSTAFHLIYGHVFWPLASFYSSFILSYATQYQPMSSFTLHVSLFPDVKYDGDCDGKSTNPDISSHFDRLMPENILAYLNFWPCKKSAMVKLRNLFIE